MVSNPWREAIEGAIFTVQIQNKKGFPILGGRLLKKSKPTGFERVENVSNPWREAIEAEEDICNMCSLESFQSLEGGY